MKRILWAVLGVAIAAAGCSDPVAPTTPTPAVPTIDETFSDTLLVLGANTHQFQRERDRRREGDAEQRPARGGGRPGHRHAEPRHAAASSIESVAVAGPSVLMSGTATVPGLYCVTIFDLGNLVEPAALHHRRTALVISAAELTSLASSHDIISLGMLADDAAARAPRRAGRRSSASPTDVCRSRRGGDPAAVRRRAAHRRRAGQPRGGGRRACARSRRRRRARPSPASRSPISRRSPRAKASRSARCSRSCAPPGSSWSPRRRSIGCRIRAARSRK